MRARVDGKTAESLHTPAAPTSSRPRTNSVCSRPMWNSVKTLNPDKVAHPVGFGEVAPAPFGFHPDRNVSSSCARTLRERQELADRRQATVEEGPGTDDQADDDRDPGDHRRRSRSAASAAPARPMPT